MLGGRAPQQSTMHTAVFEVNAFDMFRTPCFHRGVAQSEISSYVAIVANESEWLSIWIFNGFHIYAREELSINHHISKEPSWYKHACQLPNLGHGLNPTKGGRPHKAIGRIFARVLLTSSFTHMYICITVPIWRYLCG